MARSFFSDDPKDKKKKQRKTRIFEAPAMPQDASRADLRALIPPLKEQKPPAWDDSSITGLRSEEGHVGQRPPPAQPDRASLMRAGISVEDHSQPVSWEQPEGLSDGPTPEITTALWYVAQVHGEVQGTGQHGADVAFETLKYLFEPPQNEEEWAAYRDWATNTKSWSEMPKGTLGVELPADLAATMPGVFLGARDIVKDFANDEQSFWNVFDALGVLPALGIVATTTRAFRHAGDIERMVKQGVRAAQRMENVKLKRRVIPSYEGEGGRDGAYIFSTPKGDVEVVVTSPGKHTEGGSLADGDRILLAPEGVDVAKAEDTIWTSIRMVGGSYDRGSEGVLGNAITQEIWKQVADMFPDAKWIGGQRVTGSTSGKAAAGGNRAPVNTWAYVGDRSAHSLGAHRVLQRMAEENPVMYGRIIEEAAAAGIDVSPAALRRREADLVARGVPEELRPARLAHHENELKRMIANSTESDWDNLTEDMLDYLEASGIKAVDEFTGEPTVIGQAIIDGVKGDGDHVSEILNPLRSSPEEVADAMRRMEDEGIDPKTGQVSAAQQYRDRVLTQMNSRLTTQLTAAGHTPDDIRIDFDMTGERGHDIITAVNEKGTEILRMKVAQDGRYYSGIRVDEIASDFGDEVLVPLADNLRRADVGLHEDVLSYTTVQRNSEAAAAARRTQIAGVDVPGQDHMEYAAQVADRLQDAHPTNYRQNPDGLMDEVFAELTRGAAEGNALYTSREATELVDALGALADGRTSSRQTFTEMVTQGPGGTQLRNQFGEDIGSAAGRQLRQGNDPQQAAMQLVLQGFDPREARIAVSSAHGGPSPVTWTDEIIAELEDAAAARRGPSGAADAGGYVTTNERGFDIDEAAGRAVTDFDGSALEVALDLVEDGFDPALIRGAVDRAMDRGGYGAGRWSDAQIRAIDQIAENRRGERADALEAPASRAVEDYASLRAERPDASHLEITDAMEELGWTAADRMGARNAYEAVHGRTLDPEAQRIAEGAGELQEAGPRTRRARNPNNPRWARNPDDPEDRYIEVYRRHRNADAPIDPQNPRSRTGNEGAEGDRRAAYPEYYHARTPFYVKGQAPETTFENYPIQIEARIPESRFYDIHADPKGYVQKYRDGELEDFTLVEDLIKRDGDYAAFGDLERGQVWAFDTLEETNRVHVRDGTFFDNSGNPLPPGQTPFTARGIDPTEHAGIGVTQAQQRSRIRQGTAAEYELQAWPGLVRAEYGPQDTGRRGFGDLLSDESGEVTKHIPGGGQPEDARRLASGRGAQQFNEMQPAEITEWDHKVAATLNAGDGVSMGINGKPLPKRLRYVVSPNKNTETIFEGGPITAQEVANFRELHHGALSEKGAVFGAWLDDGKLYMDVSRGFSSRSAAMDVAQVGDQMSVADRKFLPKATGGLAKEADWDNAFISNPLYDEGRGVTNWPTERARVEARGRVYEHMPELARMADERMLRNMGPQTRAWYDGSRKHIQERVREMYRVMLSDEELATMMALGEQTKGWYEGAAGTIKNAYGWEDAPQFTALLAATSPNVPVESNVRFAQDMWAEWNARGRPRDPEFIQDIFDDVAGGLNLEGHQVVPNANKNTIEVLSHPEPYEWFGDPANWERGDILSGDKVDPFFANSIGELRRMTVDTHQLRYGPAADNSLSRRAAFEAAFTGGAAELARALEMPGALKVAHGQEMSWEPIRQLGEMAGRGRGSVEDLLFNADGSFNMETLAELDRRMAAANDFGQYLGSEEGRQLVGRAGGNPDFEIVNRTGLDPEAAAAARQRVLDNPEHVRAATRRSDMGYAGDNLLQLAPWIAGGAGASLMRHLDPNDEKPPQQPELPRGLFDGASLPFVGSSGSN